MALFKLIPQVFIQENENDKKPHKYFEFFKQFDYFDPSVVYLNQNLVDLVTPKTFDLLYDYKEYESLPYLDCPEETIRKWGERGTRFIHLNLWMYENIFERFEKFSKYLSSEEYQTVFDSFTFHNNSSEFTQTLDLGRLN